MLPYGRSPIVLELDDGSRVLDLPVVAPATRSVDDMLDEALAAVTTKPRRATLVVSDATRDEPREKFVSAIRRRLPHTNFTIAVATGTHGPSADLGFAVDVNHDGHRAANLVDLGTTSRGTPIRVHRCAVETDLVIATGVILPHYFAGFSAGAKAIFPGLGEAAAIRTNHAHKTHPSARAGNVDDNIVRLDLEEAVAVVERHAPQLLVNGVVAGDHAIRAVVTGDMVEAHRRGCERARPWFTASTSPAPVVIASDVLPITASLYQAAKIAAAVAPLVAENGRLIVVAECADGIGPLDTVNEAIFRIGVLPRLRPNVRLELRSSLSDDDVRQTLLSPIHELPTHALVIPRASQLIFTC